MFCHADIRQVQAPRLAHRMPGSNLSNRMKKRHFWIKEGDRWRIVYEGAA
ncbi:MAG: hypothetical protein ACREVM_03370 [Burkholderiales bacterium]